MDIEKVALENPEKIITTKVDLQENLREDDILTILKPFKLNDAQKKGLI